MVFMGIVILPLVVTVAARLDNPPGFHVRVGVVDHGNSSMPSALASRKGFAVTPVADADELRRLVTRHRFDAGLVLPDGFDESVRAGEKPAIEFHVCGESFPSKHVLFAATTIDLVREIEQRTAAVVVDVDRLGEGRMLPFDKLGVLIMTGMVLMMSGIFLPALSLVEERESGTLGAMLTTPAQIHEVLVAKAVMGMLVAVPMSYITLLMNSALPHEPSAVFVTLAVGGVECAVIGLIFGTVARNAPGVFALMETLFILLLGTLLLCAAGPWGEMLAKAIPSYWFVLPLYLIAVEGIGLEALWPFLLVALALSTVMVLPIALLARRLKATLAKG
jgi:ABC-2 type transport system permease protein